MSRLISREAPADDYTVRPEWDAHTLFLLDTDAEALLPAGDTGLFMNNISAGDLMPWAGSSKIDVVAGKFRTGLKCNTQSQGNIQLPCHGLLPADEWTVEGWVSSTADWSGISNKQPFGFYVNSGEYVRLRIDSNIISFDVLHSHNATADVSKSASTAATPLADTFVHVRATYKATTLKLYLNGVLKATTTGVTLPPIFSDQMRQSGLLLCGANAVGATGITVSDFRVSNVARVPGERVTITSPPRVIVNTASLRGDTIQPKLIGGLHGVTLTETTDVPAAATRVEGTVKVIRTDKFLSVSPIKAGSTDATHPTLGHSGSYSYDWQVVDRTIAYLNLHGWELYLSIDSCPQLLGGTTAPYSGTDLTTKRSQNSTFNTAVPNDIPAFATMAADLVHHITVDLGTPIPYADLWNEPGEFLDGANDAARRVSYQAMYDAVMPAVRAVSPSTKLGGPGTSHFDTTWANGLIAGCKSSGAPLDFISYHEYTGSVALADKARMLVERYRTANSWAGALELVNAEFNSTNNANFPGNGQTPWGALNYGTNDFAAAIYATNLIEFQRLGFARSIWTNIVTDDAGVGYFSTGLVSQTGWRAPGNVARLWQMLATTAVATTVVGDPSLTALASKQTGKTTVLLARTNFRENGSKRVSLQGLPAGTVTAYMIDDAHSNYADAGSGHADLETITAPVIDAAGRASVVMKPRSVCLLSIV